MYRTYSYNDMPKPVMRQREEERPKPPPKCEEERPKPPRHEEKECCEKKCDDHRGGFLDGLFGNMEADDIILLIVVLALIMDDCDDKLLLIVLGFIFISEWL